MATKTRKKKKGAARKKRRTQKKAVRRKRAVRKKRAFRKTKKKAIKAPPKGPKLPAEPMGRVTHYFPKAGATAVMIEREEIRMGDVLYFKGHTTNFKQRVESLQINHQPVSQAAPGEEVGIRVRARTREHDLVFKLPA